MYTKDGMQITVPYSVVEKAHELYRKMNTKERNKGNAGRLEETERIQNHISEIVVTIIVNEIGPIKMIK